MDNRLQRVDDLMRECFGEKVQLLETYGRYRCACLDCYTCIIMKIDMRICVS